MGWARLAGFVCERDETSGIIALRPEGGAPVGYYIRPRGLDRVDLVEVDDTGAERLLLFVADMRVEGGETGVSRILCWPGSGRVMAK